jgi:hypothetical protein
MQLPGSGQPADVFTELSAGLHAFKRANSRRWNEHPSFSAAQFASPAAQHCWVASRYNLALHTHAWLLLLLTCRCFGVPLSVLFGLKLGMSVRRFWLGLLCTTYSTCAVQLLIIARFNWPREV